jgi:hypothetical protein
VWNVRPPKAIHHAHMCQMPCQVSSSTKPSLEPSPSSPSPPRVMSWARQVTSRPPKANVQVENGGSSSSSHAKVPPKATPSILKVQCPSSHVPQTWGLASIIGLQSPHGGRTKSSPHEYLFTGKGPAKTNRCTLQGSTSHKNHAK